MKKTLPDGRPYAADKVGFGIYHFAQGGIDARGFFNDENFAHDGEDRKQCDYQEKLDYMNFYIYRLNRGCYDHLRRIKEMGCVTWVYYQPFVAVEISGVKKYYLKADWKEEIVALIDGVKKEGLWDVVAGFQYDEPMLRVDNDVFEEFTKYIAGFDKRQMAIFSYYEVVGGSHPRSNDPEFGMESHLVTERSCKYLTDIGFDWYGITDYDKYKKVTQEMLMRIGREDVYIWYVPTTWTYYDQAEFTEDLCIENLNIVYRLLLDSKHPGGLFCYTWRSWCHLSEGLDYRFNTNNKQRWDRLEGRMMQIGREIRELKLDKIVVNR